MRPLRTGAGTPIEIAVKSQSPTASLNLATNSFGFIRAPEANLRWSRSDISNFTFVPPISTTRTFFFMSNRVWANALLADTNRTRESLENALAFRFRRGGGRPALDNLQGKKAEQREPREFPIE